ncbi:SIS domain-containing protein [Emcibacteraceae bacterium]|nr:SIS domain-containing protein [Emcibacteraceae bacterium]
MTKILGFEENTLRSQSAYWTAREIEQQPDVWQKVADDIIENHAGLDDWLKSVLSDPCGRIILTGAGTSAYVGETLAPFLSKALSRPVEAISTTDIVSAPQQYLIEEKPTLIISYARSGNSPESVAACQLCDQLIENAYHLIITCNKDGALAKIDNANNTRYVLMMPEETNDKSFAMTSSFSSMMLATALVFKSLNQKLDETINISRSILNTDFLRKVEILSQKPFSRVVCLGAGGLLGIAREASLKILELSNGKLDCYFESSLGFRHGPKLVVDKNTLVVLLGSNDEYTQKYDRDLLKEIKDDNIAKYIVNLSAELSIKENDLDDLWVAFPYILYCQIFAFYKSLALDVTPDNPCPTGEANRVVQGVKIYPHGGK